MDRDLQKIQQIILRSLLEQESDEEREILEKWCRESEANREFYAKISDSGNVREKMESYHRTNVRLAFEKNQKLLQKRIWRRMSLRMLPYAALLVLVFGVTLLWNREVPIEPVSVPTGIATIPAGNKRAELVLANGDKISLSDGVNTKLKQGSSEIIITGERIDYKKGTVPAAEAFNTIRTPLGGEYTITLSDGTVVWLNAMSELQYPVEFTGEKRVVKLKGEAYFEVRPDAGRAFIVDVNDYQVKVLGTSFNISSYANDAKIYTTLCTGKVLVKDQAHQKQMELMPGQQLICDVHSGEMLVKQVDSRQFTAWVRGCFEFDNQTIEEIFDILQRWYDIQVFYADPAVRKEIFTGRLPRFDNLNTILNIMQEVSDVNFELKGNTILIK